MIFAWLLTLTLLTGTPWTRTPVCLFQNLRFCAQGGEPLSLALECLRAFNCTCVYDDVSALELLGYRDLAGKACGGRFRREGLSNSLLDILFCKPTQSLNRMTVPHFDLNLSVEIA
jgi:hypothetical protein